MVKNPPAMVSAMCWLGSKGHEGSYNDLHKKSFTDFGAVGCDSRHNAPEQRMQKHQGHRSYPRY
jgi:hypothetical protein